MNPNDPNPRKLKKQKALNYTENDVIGVTHTRNIGEIEDMLFQLPEFKNYVLTIASTNGYKDVVEFLLDNSRVDINFQDSFDGYTHLMEATQQGHKDVVKLLIDRGADMNLQSGNHGLTALNIAVGMGHRDIVELLLNAGADPNIQDNYGITPLIQASYNMPDIVALLLNAGADISIENNDGSTALDIADGRHNEEIANLLRNA